jgi:hypothetical protein
MIDLTKIKLAICTPVAGGLEPEYVRSIIELLNLCSANGIECAWDCCALGSNSTAKNMLAAQFLSDPTLTHVVFVDGDLKFEAASIIRMIECNVDFVGCTYRYKIAASEAISFVVQATKEQLAATVCDGMLKVHAIGGGLMLFKRQTLERLDAAYPELRCFYNGVPAIGAFDEWTDPETRGRCSEDIAVCHRMRLLGIDIHVLVDAKTTHYGRGNGGWTGNFADLLSATRGQEHPGAFAAPPPPTAAVKTRGTPHPVSRHAHPSLPVATSLAHAVAGRNGKGATAASIRRLRHEAPDLRPLRARHPRPPRRRPRPRVLLLLLRSCSGGGLWRRVCSSGQRRVVVGRCEREKEDCREGSEGASVTGGA